jgi:hypothetical protein
MGVADVSFVRVKTIGYGPEARKASISAAASEITALTLGAKATQGVGFRSVSTVLASVPRDWRLRV